MEILELEKCMDAYLLFLDACNSGDLLRFRGNVALIWMPIELEIPNSYFFFVPLSSNDIAERQGVRCFCVLSLRRSDSCKIEDCGNELKM